MVELETIRGTIELNDKFSTSLNAFSTGLNTAQTAGTKFVSFIDQLNAKTAQIADEQNKAAMAAKVTASAYFDIGGSAKLTADQISQMTKEMDKGIQAQLAMGKAVPEHWQAAQTQLQAAGAAAKKTGDDVHEAGSKLDNFFDEAVAHVGHFVAGMVAFETAEKIVHAFVETIEHSVQAYADLESAERRLSVSMGLQGHGTKEAAAEMEELTHQLRQNSVYSHIDLVEAEALFSQLGNVGPAKMKAALQASMDLASGLGKDLDTVIKAVAKAGEGSTTALKRMVPSLSGLSEAGGDLNAVAEEIEKHFGGQAAAELDTYAGQVAQMGNEWHDLQVQIGEAIVKDDLFQASLHGLHAMMSSTKVEGDGMTASTLAYNAAIAAGFPLLADFIGMLKDVARYKREAAQAGGGDETHNPDGSIKVGAEVRHVPGEFHSQAGKDVTLPTDLWMGQEVEGNKYVEALAAAQEAVRKLTAAQREEIDAAQKMGDGPDIIAKALNREYEGLHITEGAIRLYTSAQKEAAQAFDHSAPEKLRKKLEELNASVTGAQAHGMGVAEIIDTWGSAIKKTTDEATAMGVKVPKAVGNIRTAIEDTDMDKAMAHIHQVTAQMANVATAGFDPNLAKKIWDRQIEMANQSADAMMKAAEDVKKNNDAIQDAIDKRTMTSTDYRIAQIEKQRKAQIAAIDPSVTGRLYDELVDTINRKAEGLTADLEHEGKRRIDQNRLDLEQQVKDFMRTYDDMSRDASMTQKEIEQVKAHGTDVLIALQHAFGRDWKAVLTQMGIDWKQFEEETDHSWHKMLKDGLLGGLKQAAKDIPNILAQAFIEGSSLEDTMKALGTTIGADIGGAVGFAIGGPMGEAIGQALGSMLGPLMDKIIKTRAEQLVESVAKDFGVAIDEELGKAIQKRAQNEFHGSYQAAQIGSLDQIISAGGGLNFQNFNLMEQRLHDVFSMLATGQFTAAQAQDVLNKNFQQFVDFLGGDVNPELKEIIRLNQEMGTQSKAILDYIAQNADKAAAGFNKMAEGLLTITTGFKDGSDDMKQLMDAIDQASGATPGGKGPKEAPEAHIGVEERKRGKSVGVGEFAPEFLADLDKQLKRLQPIAEATFSALLAGGKSVTEALAEMEPGLANIEKILKATGKTADGFLGKVIGWENVVKENKELFDVLGGVTDMLKGLNNAGALTQDAFAALTGTVADAFSTLTGQGVSATDAITMMQPQLQEIWELQKDFGYAVDDATQALLDQAVAAGQVGEKHRSVQEQTLDVMKHLDDVLSAIGQKFGVDIPRDVDQTGQAFKDLGGDIDNAVSKIPDSVHIPVKWDIQALQTPTGPPSEAPEPHAGHATPMEHGGPVPEVVYAARGLWVPKGNDIHPAMLASGEFVMPEPSVNAIGAATLESWRQAGHQPTGLQGGAGSTSGEPPEVYIIPIMAGRSPMDDATRLIQALVKASPRIQKNEGAVKTKLLEALGQVLRG